MYKNILAVGGVTGEAPCPPEQIVSTISSASELICVLGGMDNIVGRDEYSRFPPGLDEKPVVGSSIRKTISVERVLDLDPDMVITGRHIPSETLETIESAGVPVVVVGTSCEAESLIRNVRMLGEMMDTGEMAEELVGFVEGYANLVRGRTRDLDIEDKPLVYHECAFGEYRTTAAGTPVDECITLAGGVNIAHDEVLEKPVVSGEWVTEKNPDIIISQVPSRSPAIGEVLREKRDVILSRPELKETNAIKSGKVYVSHLFLRRGPRLVGYLLYLGKWFHPELFEDIDPAAAEREMLQEFYGIELEGTWAYPEI